MVSKKWIGPFVGVYAYFNLAPINVIFTRLFFMRMHNLYMIYQNKHRDYPINTFYKCMISFHLCYEILELKTCVVNNGGNAVCQVKLL